MNLQTPRDFIDRRQLVSALRALRRGDFSVRLPEVVADLDSEIATLFNEVVSINEEDLRRNVEEFRELLVESGYAKAYADGRTMVTTRPEGSL